MNLFFVLILLFAAAIGNSAEFLIKAQPTTATLKPDKTLEEIEAAERGYQIGDIVSVFSDGKLSDYAHAGGKFYVIRVTGLDVGEAKKYMATVEEEYEEIDGTITRRTKKRREYNILLDNLPVPIRNKLYKDFVYNTSWDKIKEFVYDKVSQTTEK